MRRKRLFARTVCVLGLISDWRTIVPHCPQLAAYKPQTMYTTWRGLDRRTDRETRQTDRQAGRRSTSTSCLTECLTDNLASRRSRCMTLLSFPRLSTVSCHIYRFVSLSVRRPISLSLRISVRSFVWLSVLGVNYSIQLSREKLPECRRATGGLHCRRHRCRLFRRGTEPEARGKK